MNKKSTKNSQQSFFKKLWNSKPFWAGLIIVGALVIVSLFIHGARTGNPPKNTYGDLLIPSSWKQMSYTHEDGIHCFLSDNPCPARHYTFQPMDINTIESNIIQLNSQLQKKGYAFDDKCLRPSCEDYFIYAHNSDVTVRISSQKDGSGHDVVYLDIEAN